jgi:hypothetical protein
MPRAVSSNFAAKIRYKNTRMAYHRATCHFFAWVEQHQIGEFADIDPFTSPPI